MTTNENANARWLVELLTQAKWIRNPKPLTKREQKLYVKACRRRGQEWRDADNAREVATWRLALVRSRYGVLYGTDNWRDTAGHTGDFGYLPFAGETGTWDNLTLDCPLTLALEAMAADTDQKHIAKITGRTK